MLPVTRSAVSADKRAVGGTVSPVSADRSIWQFSDEVNAQPGWNVVLTTDIDVSRALKQSLVDAVERSRDFD